VHYGTMSAKIKTGRWAGVVTAFITMSDIHDEIDWEWPGNYSKEAQSNWFWQGNIPSQTNGETHAVSSDTYSDWHTYTIEWLPTTMTFLIDNTVVRTVSSNSSSKYPNTPSRIEFSLWAAGTAAQAPGTVQWAGGLINWNDPDYTAAGGHFQALVESVSVVCADPSSPPSGTTSYIYGSNSTTNTPSISFSKLTTIVGTTSNLSSNGSSSSTNGSASSLDSTSGSSGSSPWLTGRTVGIIAGSIAALILAALIAYFVVSLFGRRSHKGGNPSEKGIEAQGITGQDSRYHPLYDPAPNAASETHALPSLHYDGGHYE